MIKGIIVKTYINIESIVNIIKKILIDEISI